ncbi:hypothetical protein [Nonomuraea sp. B19D2]|uniref:hypothetical protein n=1 Tax=Nonomuraea sp. B19D2 TaxID=3159561 RepID=UPI0032DA7390
MHPMDAAFERALELQAHAEREFNEGSPRVALDAVIEAILLLRGIAPAPPLALARALDQAARYLMTLDRISEALPLAREAVSLASSGGDDRLRRKCAATLAACHRALDDGR